MGFQEGVDGLPRRILPFSRSRFVPLCRARFLACTALVFGVRNPHSKPGHCRVLLVEIRVEWERPLQRLVEIFSNTLVEHFRGLVLTMGTRK